MALRDRMVRDDWVTDEEMFGGYVPSKRDRALLAGAALLDPLEQALGLGRRRRGIKAGDGLAGENVGDSPGQSGPGAVGTTGPGDVVGFDPGLAATGVSLALGVAGLAPVGAVPAAVTAAGNLAGIVSNAMGINNSNFSIIDENGQLVSAIPTGSLMGIPHSFVENPAALVDDPTPAGIVAATPNAVTGQPGQPGGFPDATPGNPGGAPSGGPGPGGGGSDSGSAPSGDGGGQAPHAGGPIKAGPPRTGGLKHGADEDRDRRPNVAATLEAGEFVVKAAAAQKYKAILAAINADQPKRISALAKKLTAA